MGMTAIAGALMVAVAPMHAEGPTPQYPRLTRFPNATVMNLVNAKLQALEKENRGEYQQCLDNLRAAKMKADNDPHWVDIKVGYLSSRYLSLDIHSEDYCGGAHPSFGPSPVTFDLSTGSEIDWTKAFHPSFWSGGIDRLYRKYYPWTKADQAAFEKSVAKGDASEDDNCKKMIDEQANFPVRQDAIFRLRRGQGLMLQPDFPHVVQNCAEEVALPASELEPYLKDATLLVELRSKELTHDR
jgi:hypothetical protein